jgi:hypothetical protein
MLQTCVVGCCKHYFSMLQTLVSMLRTCGVGCCVEEKGEEAPEVGCCMQHGSQHDRNIVATWGGEKKDY